MGSMLKYKQQSVWTRLAGKWKKGPSTSDYWKNFRIGSDGSASWGGHEGRCIVDSPQIVNLKDEGGNDHLYKIEEHDGVLTLKGANEHVKGNSFTKPTEEKLQMEFALAHDAAHIWIQQINKLKLKTKDSYYNDEDKGHLRGDKFQDACPQVLRENRGWITPCALCQFAATVKDFCQYCDGTDYQALIESCVRALKTNKILCDREANEQVLVYDCDVGNVNDSDMFSHTYVSSVDQDWEESRTATKGILEGRFKTGEGQYQNVRRGGGKVTFPFPISEVRLYKLDAYESQKYINQWNDTIRWYSYSMVNGRVKGKVTAYARRLDIARAGY